jgi:hypothetical protein
MALLVTLGLGGLAIWLATRPEANKPTPPAKHPKHPVTLNTQGWA